MRGRGGQVFFFRGETLAMAGRATHMTERAEDFNLALKQLHRLLVAHELVLLDLCRAKAGPSQVVSAGD